MERKTDYGRHDGRNFTKSMRILLQTYFLAFTQILNEFKYLKEVSLKRIILLKVLFNSSLVYQL
jgi:hypothetical protein